MLDDAEARRALEREAIALVNLSNPTKPFAAMDADVEAVHARPHPSARKPRGPAVRSSNSSSSSTTTACGPAEDDANISMKSLLVTLKKRKLERPADDKDAPRGPSPSACAADMSPAASPGGVDVDVVADVDVDVDPRAKLPSFRALFYEAPPSAAAAGPSPSPSPSAPASAVAASAELKCKYRTGKCNNVRALKSCGDYHNLCNYHRLRANANQRKLDRKKKVQRMQLSVALAASADPRGPDGPSSSAGTGSSSASARPAANLSHAAAVALVAMPSSLPPSHPQPQLRYDPKTLVPYLVASAAAEDVRAKQEKCA